MFVSLAILLLLIFTLGFWVVKTSKVHAFIKVTTITLFFAFCVFMAVSMDSSMGWAAIGRVGVNMSEIVTIRHVVIREPNEKLGFDGSIYLLLDVTETISDRSLLKVFAHKPEGLEPRLYRLPYSRKFHEELQKNVIPRLLKGQIVTGKIGKGKETGGDNEGVESDFDGPAGKGKRRSDHRGNRGNQHGAGNDDRTTEFHFYELPPSYFHPKEG